VFGLFVGALQLFLLVNACLRSIGGKWAVGAIGGLTRTVLLLALTMATARIRLAGAQPSPGYAVAMFTGPAISFVTLALAFRRRRGMPAGSEAETAADKVVTAWIAAGVIDAMFLVIAIAAISMSGP